MKIVGCDFHPGQQQVAALDTMTGEVEELMLSHGDGQAERFYRALEAPGLVGIEAVGNSLWFEQMVERLGHRESICRPRSTPLTGITRKLSPGEGTRQPRKEASAHASAIKNLVNTTWEDAKGNHFYSALDDQHHLKESDAAAVLYRDATDDGLKMESALKDLIAAAQHHSECGVEGESHYAEILYRYGAADAAYSVIMDLTTPGHCRQEYPEVSYSVIGAITTGLMGVDIKLTRSKVIETLPALTHQTAWAEIRNLPVGSNSVKIRHDGIH